MQNIIDSGFTLYIKKGNDGFTGTGLKKLEEGRGIHPIEIKKEKLNILNQLPALTKELGNGSMLQIYRYDFCYFAQLGKTYKEGPYGEEDCFEVTSESIDFTLSDILVNLEEETSKQEDISLRSSLSKKYRLYGDDKYK